MIATTDSATIGSSHAKRLSRDFGNFADGRVRVEASPVASIFDCLRGGFFFLLNDQISKHPIRSRIESAR